MPSGLCFYFVYVVLLSVAIFSVAITSFGGFTLTVSIRSNNNRDRELGTFINDVLRDNVVGIGKIFLEWRDGQKY